MMSSTRPVDRKIRGIQTLIKSTEPSAPQDAYSPESSDELDEPKVKRQRYNKPYEQHSTQGFSHSYNSLALDGAPAPTPISPSQPYDFTMPAPLSSQIKDRQDLTFLAKPVHIQDIRENLLPKDLATLFTRLNEFSGHHGIIPEEVRQQVLHLSGRTLPPYYFSKSSPTGNDTTPGLTQDNPSGEVQTHSPKLEEFLQLRRILKESELSRDLWRDECAWSNMVHSPLLTLAFHSDSEVDNEQDRQCVSARVEPVMSATISVDSLPRMKTEAPVPSPAGNDTARSLSQDRSFISQTSAQLTPEECQTENSDTGGREAVDYAVVLDIPQSLPLMDAIRRLAIRLTTDRGWSFHVNQTQYRAIRRTPIALSIASNMGRGIRDPLLPLSIWVAAWHTRMYYLRSCLDDECNIDNTTSTDDTTSNEILPQPQPRLVSVLLITIQAHEWSLYFACDQGTSITLYGPVRLGYTSSIIGLYALVSSLRAMKSWIETEFHEQLRIWFQVKEIESEDLG